MPLTMEQARQVARNMVERSRKYSDPWFERLTEIQEAALLILADRQHGQEEEGNDAQVP